MRAHGLTSGRSKDRPPHCYRAIKTLASLSLCSVILLSGWLVGADPSDPTGADIHCAWLDQESLELHIGLALPAETPESPMWVLTVAADRFSDGIYAWQLHLSEQFESVLIIPNDFLTARNFSLSQVGIEVVEHVPGAFLRLRIPRYDVIAELIAPGDRVDVHALWMQQTPIVSFAVPAPGDGTVATSIAGGGATVDEPEPHGEPSTSPLPDRDEYRRGEPIVWRFVLLDGESGDPMLRVGASFTLARAQEKGPYEIVLLRWIQQDPETGILEYEIGTASLDAGTYELIVATMLSAEAYRMQVRILPPAAD